MEKKITKPDTALYPVPAVMVSCGTLEGAKNIITLAWVGTVNSDPPMVGIGVRPNRYSHAMIKDGGDFVVNLPSREQARATDYCGVASGRDVDKFAAMGLTPVAATHVKSPLIGECPVNIECRVRQVVSLGSHDLFLGEILAVHTAGEVLDAAGRIDAAKADPVVYIDGRYWSVGEFIGNHGFSLQR